MLTVFCKYCERTEVWAALSERSYEGIGFISVAIVRGIKAKADVRRYKKNAQIQKKSRKVDFRRDFYKIGSIIILVAPEVYYVLLVA